jgi:hypothetical protein
MGFTKFLGDKVFTLLLIPVFLLLLWVYPLIKTQPFETSFYNPLFSRLEMLLALLHLETLIALVLVIVQSMLLSSLVSKHHLLNAGANTVGYLYALLLSCHPNLLVLHPALLINILILLTIDRIFISYRKKEVFLEVYEQGLYSSLAALIYLPGIVLLPFIWVANAIIRPFSWKEYAIQGLGLITPFYIGAATLYCFGGIEPFRTELSDFFLPLYTLNSGHPTPYPLLIVFGLGILLGISPIINEIRSRAIRGKKMFYAISWLVLFCLLSIILLDPDGQYTIPILFIPLSIYLANASNHENRKWIKVIIFFLTLCVVVYTHIVTLQ